MKTMNFFERLKQDHDRHRALSRKLAATTGDSEERRGLWDRFRPEVEAHANAEEQTLYAALMEKRDGQEKAQHSVSEHKEAADLIEEIAALDMSSPAWLQKFKELQHELEHHMEEEEREVFPLAQKLLDASMAEALTEKFEQRKIADFA